MARICVREGIFYSTIKKLEYLARLSSGKPGTSADENAFWGFAKNKDPSSENLFLGMDQEL